MRKEKIEKKPKCKLSGKDGNVFNLMGLASQALRKAGQADKAGEMVERIYKEAKSYSQAMCIISDYVEVS